ncbi:DUF2157 domain-containing protein [Desulfopila inferna]|uniref:DUF2157 domain-containing protein n=1 Tax=Desulfopila inferna TaxID=468528 RepID=UPI001966AED9|nr:DUF2157 domain-containing protein [Desulfopila inferna]MBM9603358.1 DUF2157 domain-containing protein [Desulfopila inferna]
MSNHRQQLLRWAEQGSIPADKMDAALKTAGLLPGTRDWSRFLGRLLLVAGMLSLAVSVLFFFAFNWHSLGRLTKLGLIESLIILSLIGYCYFGGSRLTGKIILTVAMILLGVLMALFGQIYQTGADTWQLFAGWALLAFPWVLIGRFAPLWLLWAVLVNFWVYLYNTTFPPLWWAFSSTETTLWTSFFFNTLLLILWEMGTKYFSWLEGRWAIRLLAVAGGTVATMIVIFTIVDRHQAGGWNILLYLGWCTGIYLGYRHFRHDLFMLAGLCLSIIIGTMVLLAKVLLDSGNAGGFLFIALAMVAMSAISAVWLKKVHGETVG